MRLLKVVSLAASALLVLQPVTALAGVLPLRIAPGAYSLALYDCMGLNTTCNGAITTYEVDSFDGSFFTAEGVSRFEMNFPSGQTMLATAPAGSPIDTVGTGFSLLPASFGLASLRAVYPLFPIVVDTQDFTARELILSSQELSGSIYLRYSLKATRFLSSGQKEMRIFAGYADRTSDDTTGPTLPVITDALRLSIISDDIRAYLDGSTGSGDSFSWFSLVSRDSLLQTLRNIDAGQVSGSDIRFDFEYSVPEPGTLALLGLGLLGIGVSRRRRREAATGRA